MIYVKRLLITAVAASVMAVAVVGGLLYWGDFNRQEPPPPPGEQLPRALVVYCMHDSQRDMHCRRIEESAEKVLEDSFSEDVEAERIVRLLVNYEHPGNRFIIDQYDVKKPTVVIVDGRPGDNFRVWKNLQESIWEQIDDEEALQNILKEEIEKALRGVSAPADSGEEEADKVKPEL